MRRSRTCCATMLLLCPRPDAACPAAPATASAISSVVAALSLNGVDAAILALTTSFTHRWLYSSTPGLQFFNFLNLLVSYLMPSPCIYFCVTAKGFSFLIVRLITRFLLGQSSYSSGVCSHKWAITNLNLNISTGNILWHLLGCLIQKARTNAQ